MSKLIKSPFTNAKKEEFVQIGIKPIQTQACNDEFEMDEQEHMYTNVSEEANQLIEQAKADAAEIIANAERQAEEMRQQLDLYQQQVHEQLEQLQREAQEVGYNEGFEHGLDAGKAACEQDFNQAKAVIASSKQDYHNRVEQAEPVIIDIALAICQKMMPGVISQLDDAWMVILKEAIKEVRDREDVTLYIHPVMYERTLSHKEEISSLLSQTQELYIYPDSQLDEQGCIIETPFGRIDASVDSQLTEIKARLHEKLKEASTSERA
ncbi:flagellar assembly protein FliH [Alkalihalobacillus sp. LMS39]|uniref:flagellar assembly protein FliH n=1 Tax=Alkalihalobacillus sp. LMS39 TaxID=2924032 RepID=UPI001FB3D1DC|nr:flagellar assembly protein FliH [Alkalihalobacillus sp. LMS39]UOE92840.1 flagellar assembly protein FliH [Alkalihalobacillus sp. LMS39]